MYTIASSPQLLQRGSKRPWSSGQKDILAKYNKALLHSTLHSTRFSKGKLNSLFNVFTYLI